MNKILLSTSLVLAQMLAVNALAQVKGEVDPATSKAMPAAKATPEQKAAAKAKRKTEGAAAAKAFVPGEASPTSTGPTTKVSKDERKVAAAKRKAAATQAVKKGEIPSGEK